MQFDGIGNLFVLLEVLFRSYDPLSPEPVLKRVELRLGGVGEFHLDRVVQVNSVDNLFLTANMKELGISEDGARTVISNSFGKMSGIGFRGDNRFEEFRLETNDFSLTVTFLEGEISMERVQEE